MRVYLDTSFLISLYSADANSIAAAQMMQASRNVYLVSTFTELEMINALQLRVFRKEILSAQATSSLHDFEQDLRQGVFQFIRRTEDAFQRAHRISRRTTARLGTRTVDLLHVAAAIELNADCLYSFDRQQRKLARVFKLKLN